ncbi:MAG: hypothetical protein QM811_14020 [Pirellulales bacterium]
MKPTSFKAKKGAEAPDSPLKELAAAVPNFLQVPITTRSQHHERRR